MLNRRKALAVAIVVLLASSAAGFLYYYEEVAKALWAKESALHAEIARKNAETAATKGEISDFEAQISNLTGIVNGLAAANLVTSLETHEMIGSASSYMGGLVPTPLPFNYLWISGAVTNQGKGYAVDAGFQVVIYGTNGTVLANATVPFIGETFGTDNATNAFVTQKYGASDFTLKVLDSGQTTDINLNMFHQGVATNWTVTPVCWSYHLDKGAFQNAPLSSQVSYLQNQVRNLNTLITNLTTTHLAASLNIKAYPAMTQYGVSYSSSLWIVGSVTNTGEAKAYNAGLRVVAYNAQGSLEINMTFPLMSTPSTYNATSDGNIVLELSTLNSGYGYDSFDSSNSKSIGLTIYTEEQVSNWTVTPVWTNTP